MNGIKENVTSYLNKNLSKEQLLINLGVNENNIINYMKQDLQVVYNNGDGELLEYLIYLIFLYEVELFQVINILNNLIICKWHEQHENIVILLQKARSESSIEYLYKAIKLKPDYLEFDDNYAFEVKCIWALGDIGNKKAKEKLQFLVKSDNKIINKNALLQLERVK